MISVSGRAQSGTVLPVCLLFLFLIAQLAMSAMETASLNHALVANVRQASDVSRAAQLALDHALEQLASPDAEFPLLGSEWVSDSDAEAQPLRFSYRMEVVDAGSGQSLPEAAGQWLGEQAGVNLRGDYCALHHRIESAVYGSSDSPLQRNRMGHYLCCDEAPDCPAPSLSVWATLE